MLVVNFNNGEQLSDWDFMEKKLPALQKEVEEVVHRSVKIEYAPLLGVMEIPDDCDLVKTYGCSFESLPSEEQNLAKQILDVMEKRGVIKISLHYLEVSQIADLCLCCNHPRKIYAMGKFRFEYLNHSAFEFYVYLTDVSHDDSKRKRD